MRHLKPRLTNSQSSIAGLEDRFWYWHGKSGKRYIHSIYRPENCPPLPGAIYVPVKRLDSGKRIALAVGRFDDHWGQLHDMRGFRPRDFAGADEVHVHLLAENEDCAKEIAKDLRANLGLRPVVDGFCEERAEQVGLPLSAPPQEALAPPAKGSLANAVQASFFDTPVAERSLARA